MKTLEGGYSNSGATSIGKLKGGGWSLQTDYDR
jgi:hypothetical protein